MCTYIYIYIYIYFVKLGTLQYMLNNKGHTSTNNSKKIRGKEICLLKTVENDCVSIEIQLFIYLFKI